MLAQLTQIDLTTASQQPRQQAAEAVKAVVERLDDHQSERRNLVLQPKLIVRHTTAAAEAAVS